MTTKKFYVTLGILAIMFIGICVFWIVNEMQLADMRKEFQADRDKRKAEAEQDKGTSQVVSDAPAPVDAPTEEISIEESSDFDVLNADRTNSSLEKIELSEAEIEERAKALREQQLAEYIAKWGEPPFHRWFLSTFL